MRWWLLLVLALVGSCAPDRRVLVVQAIPERPATLLRKLALDVPADVAKMRLAGSAADAVARIAAAPAFSGLAQGGTDAARALDCLTAAVYHEARSETDDGQRAVAQVVLNRVRDRAFPASVCGVVYQGSNRRTGCQFSFTCDGSLDRTRDPNAWAHAASIAAAALNGAVYAPVGSATHYHTSAISPWWAPSLTRLASVGAHVFYRWPAAMERALAFRQDYAGYEPAIGIGGRPAAETQVAGGDMVNGVRIHRGGDIAAPVPAAAAVAASAEAVRSVRIETVAGVRIHRSMEMGATTTVAGVRVHRTTIDQPSRSPMPIEARAASASLETTG